MFKPDITPREALERLDARHDELIRKLDELNHQIENALAQFAAEQKQQADLSKAA
jgi:hypothetical protein